jgi:HAMP domain-containing protein
MLLHAMSTMSIAAGAGAILVLLLTMMAVRRITGPLKSVTTTLTSLAEGKPDVQIDHTERHDEIGAIARTIGVFKNNSLERRRLEAERKSAEAEAAERRKAELRGFVDEFQNEVGGIIDKVLTSSNQFEIAARHLTDTARSTADMSGKSADKSTLASEHVRNAAAASEEMAASISEIGRRVQDSNGIAAEAVKQAAATDERMAELSKAGDRIGNVVKLITSIAEQTNLLALNATIEAAGDRRNQQSHRQHAVGDAGVGCGDQGDRADDRAHQRYRDVDRRRRRSAGRGDAGDRAQRFGRRDRHVRSCGQCRKRRDRCKRDRRNIRSNPEVGAELVQRQSSAQSRSVAIPRRRPRRLTLRISAVHTPPVATGGVFMRNCLRNRGGRIFAIRFQVRHRFAIVRAG